MTKKKIAFFIPTLGGGGAEKVLVNLVNNMNQDEFDITIKVLFDGGENKKYLSSDIKYEFVFKKVFRGNIHFLKLFTPKYLYKKIFTEKYDYVISYLEGPTTRIVSGCEEETTKILNWVHNEFYNQNTLVASYRSSKELVESYLKYDSTVFVSKVAEKAFQQAIPEVRRNLKVLYNTVETDCIVEQSLEQVETNYFNKQTINLISVGRFIPQKGFERLINVVNRLLKEDGLNIHLYLLGKGVLKNKYDEILKSNDLVDYVTYLGYQDNPYKYVQKADVFVCSSLHEGYSTAVSESVIIGTPVITTNCSGMKEILGNNNEYGIVCENNEESLYEAIKEYLMDPEIQEKYKQATLERRRLFDTQSSVQEVERHLLSV